MDKNSAALGSGSTVATCLAVDPAKLTPDERIHLLEEQMRHMHRVLMKLKKDHVGTPAQAAAMPADGLNKDGIPIGIVCIGATEKSPFLYYLTVEENGYTVGSQTYASLSAAAEAVSLVRRSGWTFWKLLNGMTLKEAYKT